MMYPVRQVLSKQVVGKRKRLYKLIYVGYSTVYDVYRSDMNQALKHDIDARESAASDRGIAAYPMVITPDEETHSEVVPARKEEGIHRKFLFCFSVPGP